MKKRIKNKSELLILILSGTIKTRSINKEEVQDTEEVIIIRIIDRYRLLKFGMIKIELEDNVAIVIIIYAIVDI